MRHCLGYQKVLEWLNLRKRSIKCCTNPQYLYPLSFIIAHWLLA